MSDRYRVRRRARWEWWWLPAHHVVERWTGTHWEVRHSCSCRSINHCVEWATAAGGGRRPEFGRLIDYGQRWGMPRRH